MAEQHVCSRQREFEEFTKRFEKLESHQYTDHDLLVSLGTKQDMVMGYVSQLILDVKKLTEQPSDRFEKLKLAATISIVTFVVTYGLNLLLK